MENQNVFQKRKFYNDTDSGTIFLISLLSTFLLALLFSMIASSIAGGQGVKVSEVTSSYAYLIPYAVCSSLINLFVYLIYSKVQKIEYRAIKPIFNMKWQTYLVVIAVGIISLFGLQYFINSVDDLLRLIGFPVENGLAIINPTNWGLYFLAVLLLAILPAICEEVIFRGVVLQGLRTRFGDFVAIIISALMFALMHMSLQQFVYPFLLGCIMGWIVLRTGSIISSIIVHFINNFLVVTFAFIQNLTGFSFALPKIWWFYLLAIGLLILTFGIYFIIDKYYFKGNSKEKVEKISFKTSKFIYISFAVSIVLFLVMTITQFAT